MKAEQLKIKRKYAVNLTGDARPRFFESYALRHYAFYKNARGVSAAHIIKRAG